MVREDLQAAERDALVKRHGYSASNITSNRTMDKRDTHLSWRAIEGWSGPRWCGGSSQRGLPQLVTRTHAELELTDSGCGGRLFLRAKNRTTCFSGAAGRVGGITAKWRTILRDLFTTTSRSRSM